MSKICLLVVKTQKDSAPLEKEIIAYCKKFGFGVFTSSNYVEPVMQSFDKKYKCYSLADDFVYDNCELLLLPDGCIYNQTVNAISFLERMRVVCGLVSIIMERTNQNVVHLFVGESGTEYTEYQIYSVSVLDFPSMINRLCNCAISEPIHFNIVK